MDYIFNNIKKTNISKLPYSHIIIENFLPNNLLKNINNDFNDIDFKEKFNKKCFETKNKKIVIANNGMSFFPKLSKSFAKINSIFNNLNIYKLLCNKFNNEIKEHVNSNIDINNFDPDIKFFICECKSNYKCNPHIDYRRCIFSFLIYPDMIDTNDSRLNLYEIIEKNQDTFDIYPDEKDIILKKSIKSFNNKVIISFNSTLSYHSVKPYISKNLTNLRHYIYVAYNINHNIKTNDFWIKNAKVFSEERKNKYLN